MLILYLCVGRGLLGMNAVVMIVFGVLLFVAPLIFAPLCPWTLTVLTGRAVGAWLIGLGIGAGQAVWENDLRRARTMLVSSVVFALLQFIGLARYGNELNLAHPSAWVYLFFLVDFFVVGAYGWYAGQRLEREPAPLAA